MDRRGFSLVETVAAVAVLAILAGCVCFAAVGLKANPQREAEELASWLTERITRAQTEGSSFSLECTRRTGGQGLSLSLVWLDGRARGKKESYANEKVNMFDMAGIRTRTFDGTWQTLTPALTICVEQSAGSRERVYVRVSGEGQVNVSDNWRD